MMIESNVEDLLMEKICPPEPKESLSEKFDITLKILQKFMKDFLSKIKSDSFNMKFESIRFQSDKYMYLMWGQNQFDILIPLMKFSGTRLIELSPGIFDVRVSQVGISDTTKAILNEGNKDFSLSSYKVSVVLNKLVKEFLLKQNQDLKGFLRILNVKFDDTNRSTEVKLKFRLDYVDECREEVKSRDKVANKFTDSNEKSETLLKFIKVVGSNFIRVNLRFISGLAIESKTDYYLRASLSNNGSFLYSHEEKWKHVWFEEHWWKEEILFKTIAGADHNFRLMAAIIAYRVSNSDPDLSFLNQMHFKHNLFSIMDKEIDNTIGMWHQKSIISCFHEQINNLRSQLRQEFIPNYYISDQNLLAVSKIGHEAIRKAIDKLSLLISSKSTLFIALQEVLKKKK